MNRAQRRRAKKNMKKRVALRVNGKRVGISTKTVTRSAPISNMKQLIDMLEEYRRLL